jgi:glyoxylate/hydroxypyruvate reductase|tara:strand:+ start:92 stop:1021 length:930 start_codon:yes stop_codon:yes gene_type:complete
MNIYIACELENLEKKIIKENLKKHKLYFSNLKFKEIADNNFLKCEIVFGNIPSNWVKQSSKIKWLQLESTGFGEYSNVKKNFLNNNVIITNLKSFFACQVAQTTMAGIFSFYRGLDRFSLLKDKKKWIGDPMRAKLEILDNKNVLFFGKGSINKEISKYLKMFKCQYSFVNSKSKKSFFIKRLKKAEIVICALPGTSKTKMLFNKRMISYLSKKTILINVGRGNLIDEKYLIKRLKSNFLKGAILDVTAEEPLRKNNPLWACPSLILTQHTGGGYKDEMVDKVNFFLDNLKKYLKKSKVLNRINPSKGY